MYVTLIIKKEDGSFPDYFYFLLTSLYILHRVSWFILEPRRNSDALDNYYNYLSHLFNAHDDFTEDTRANFSFRNYLQSPLQPLADNLEAATYETFENDTIKYERYEEACYMAFMDKLKYGRFKQTEGI